MCLEQRSKFERASRSLAKTGSSFRSFLVSFFAVFFGMLFGCPKGSKRVPKMVQNRSKRGSETVLEKGYQKSFNNDEFRCQSVVNNSKINDFDALVLDTFWDSFWRCFGSPDGGQEPQNEVLKSLSKLG